MKRRITTILFVGLFFGASSGQGIYGNDWMKDLFDSINKFNANIQGNVQRVTQQIHNQVQGHLAQIDNMNRNIADKIGKLDVNEMMLHGTGPTIIINGGGSSSRTIFSGTGPNGQPYFRDTEERIIGDTLYRTDRIYNPQTKTMDEFKYTRDLKNPNSKLVPVSTTTKM